MMKYLKLLRVKHYLKNILIFLPVATGHQLSNYPLMLDVFIGFIQFCLISSAVYILNDMQDVESDRAHPTKRTRPIASGMVSLSAAKILLAVLLLSVAMISAISFNWKGLIILCIYFAANVAYSMRLKHVVIMDIAILASGYILRIVFSSALTGIPNSAWLFLAVLSASLFLAFGKRRGELKKQGDTATRTVLREYSFAYLDKCMYMAQTLLILFYSLWTFMIFPETNNMIYTVPLLIVVLLRYNLILEQDSDGDPVNTFLGDKTMIFLALAFCILFTVLLYV